MILSLMRALNSAILGLTFIACDGETTGPPSTAEVRYGLAGTVVDSSGEWLDSVAVYCLFYSSFVPSGVPEGGPLTRISEADTFGFALHQNFPNPFSHSTFVRFSLPSEAGIRLSITDSFDGLVKYTYVDHLLQGLYQLYLFRIVDSLDLRNGPHSCVLETTTGSGTYTLVRDMFVVSDSGLPSAITGINGAYVFDYKQAFVGDSVMFTSNGDDDVFPIYLTNSVYLFFRKNGYRAEAINADLFPNVLLHRDVVLLKED